MNPIINPMWFYLINTFNGLKAFFFWVGGIGIVVIGLLVMVEFTLWYEHGKYNEEDTLSLKSRAKKYRNILILSLVFIFIGVVMPSEKTCYEMIAAQIVTPDNLNAAGSASKDIVDYIVQSAESIIEAIKK